MIWILKNLNDFFELVIASLRNSFDYTFFANEVHDKNIYETSQHFVNSS